MTRFDVFNGDADGICSLHQLRLEAPCESVLVTGVKRDIALLGRVPAQAGDAVTVLDVSLERNRAALMALLARGVRIDYFDHHDAGEVPAHPALRAFIDTAPLACTSLLVDRHLGGRRRPWAAVGAYGDNLVRTAEGLLRTAGVPSAHWPALRELGEAINYNAYGDSESDLLVPPAQLYLAVRAHADPLAFAREPLAVQLVQRRGADLERARATAPLARTRGGCVVVLPAADWARRVLGAYANELAEAGPAQAHAVLREHAGGYLASVRAPLAAPRGASALCRAFARGGGREAAAGIDFLPRERLGDFLAAFEAAFPGPG